MLEEDLDDMKDDIQDLKDDIKILRGIINCLRRDRKKVIIHIQSTTVRNNEAFLVFNEIKEFMDQIKNKNKNDYIVIEDRDKHSYKGCYGSMTWEQV